MNELEAALDRIDKYIESDRDVPPDPETQISIMALTYYRIMTNELRKVTDVTKIDEANFYRLIEKATRKHVKKDHNGHYKLDI